MYCHYFSCLCCGCLCYGCFCCGFFFYHRICCCHFCWGCPICGFLPCCCPFYGFFLVIVFVVVVFVVAPIGNLRNTVFNQKSQLISNLKVWRSDPLILSLIEKKTKKTFKKIYCFCSAILGMRSLTRNLYSTLFQNAGGGGNTQLHT